MRTDLFRYTEGSWPTTLAALVRDGQLSPATLAVVEALGWQYRLDPTRDQFRLES